MGTQPCVTNNLGSRRNSVSVMRAPRPVQMPSNAAIFALLDFPEEGDEEDDVGERLI